MFDPISAAADPPSRGFKMPGVRPAVDDGGNPPSMTDPFDPALLNAVVGGDLLIARELIEDFLPSARGCRRHPSGGSRLALMEEVRAASHKLKGSASLIGARGLIALCAQLQIVAVRDDGRLIATFLAQLDACPQDVESALGTFLERAAWR